MCTHNASGHGIGCQAVCTPHIIDKHTSACEAKQSGHGIGCRAVRTPSACEAKQVSPPNLSEGGSLHSPIKKLF